MLPKAILHNSFNKHVSRSIDTLLCCPYKACKALLDAAPMAEFTWGRRFLLLCRMVEDSPLITLPAGYTTSSQLETTCLAGVVHSATRSP